MHCDDQGASKRYTSGYLVRCVVTATLVIWLTVFAPVTCSYHGFLLRPGALPAVAGMRMGGMQMGGSNKQQDGRHAAVGTRSGLGPILAGHHTAEGETAMSSLLLLAAPTLYQLEPPAHSQTRFVDMPMTTLQPWPPPEQPPRTA